MDADYFTNVYKALDVGDRGIVAVIGLEDNVFRVRHSRFGTEPGQTLPNTAGLYAKLRKTSSGTYAGVSPLDGQARHYAYRVVDGFPLVVVVGIDDQDMMTSAKVRASVFLAVVGALGLLIIAFELFRLRSVTKLERAAQAERFARKQQETEKDRLRQLFHAIPDGVFVVDEHGRVTKANAQANSLLCGPEGHMVGADIAEIGNWLFPSCSAIDIQRKEQFSSRIRALPWGEVTQFSVSLDRGKPRVLLFRSSSLTGMSDDTILVVRDITSESQLDRMKSEFVSTAAHELKTPLASIYGFSELLAAGKVPENSRKQVYDTIYDQAKKLTALLSDLLDLARIEARANNTADRRDCSLSYLLHKAREYNPRIAGRIDILPFSSDIVVHGDEKLIIQALYNLFDNAAKYSASDSLISVETRSAADGSSVNIDVSDTGMGMTRQQLDQAFKRFFRANPQSAIPGTGLGLAFVKEVAELHGGSVSIASEVDVGTCVTLRLPVRHMSR